MWYKGIGIEQAQKIAIYAIEEVKKVDPYSGGYIRVTIIGKEGIRTMNLVEIIKISSEIQNRDFELKDLWNKMILFPKEWQKVAEEQKK